jgi:demethoxyubiquinone hydroxylase (CLK1/Coq7/Cat5 family)
MGRPVLSDQERLQRIDSTNRQLSSSLSRMQQSNKAVSSTNKELSSAVSRMESSVSRMESRAKESESAGFQGQALVLGRRLQRVRSVPFDQMSKTWRKIHRKENRQRQESQVTEV